MTHARFTTRAHHRTRVLEHAHRCSKTRTGARTRARALERAHARSNTRTSNPPDPTSKPPQKPPGAPVRRTWQNHISNTRARTRKRHGCASTSNPPHPTTTSHRPPCPRILHAHQHTVRTHDHHPSSVKTTHVMTLARITTHARPPPIHARPPARAFRRIPTRFRPCASPPSYDADGSSPDDTHHSSSSSLARVRDRVSHGVRVLIAVVVVTVVTTGRTRTRVTARRRVDRARARDVRARWTRRGVHATGILGDVRRVRW